MAGLAICSARTVNGGASCGASTAAVCPTTGRAVSHGEMEGTTAMTGADGGCLHLKGLEGGCSDGDASGVFTYCNGCHPAQGLPLAGGEAVSALSRADLSFYSGRRRGLITRATLKACLRFSTAISLEAATTVRKTSGGRFVGRGSRSQQIAEVLTTTRLFGCPKRHAGQPIFCRAINCAVLYYRYRITHGLGRSVMGRTRVRPRISAPIHVFGGVRASGGCPLKRGSRGGRPISSSRTKAATSERSTITTVSTAAISRGLGSCRGHRRRLNSRR